jgi:uncharacterized delta-60 repeat protein
VRYNPNGTLDRTFSGDGVASASFFGGTGDEAAFDLAVQPDGKFLAAGGSSVPNEPIHGPTLVRFTRSGALDRTFGTDGWAGGTADVAYRVAIQENGKIIAAGGGGFLLARFTPDGVLDASFDGDGELFTPFPGFQNAPYAYDVVLQPDGKIIACGGSFEEVGFILARYEVVDGSPDPTLGSNGIVITTGFAPGPSPFVGAFAQALALQPDGKIVAVGDNQASVAIARYLGG